MIDNLEVFKYIQNDYLDTVINSKYCSNDIFDNYSYENVSGSLLLKFALKKIYCKVLKKENKRKADIDYRKEIYNVIEKIQDFNKTIIVFAPYFKNNNDGYQIRIKYIDNTYLKDYKKIYLNCCGEAKKNFSIREIDNEHIYITYNSFNNIQLKPIIDLIKNVGKTYTHSIHMFMLDDVNIELLEIFEDKKIHNTVDVHGVVPEEVEMLYKENKRFLLANMVEEYIIKNCNRIICVTNALKDHLIKKYNIENKFVILPVQNETHISIDEVLSLKSNKDKPTIIYSGGIQPWQNIELMNEIIKKTYDKYNYEIYVPNVEEYKRTLDKETIGHIKIETKNSDELKDVYLKADYGFALRDDNIINNVACPTKIVEYIEYGVIPIFKTKNIGDFNRLGIKSVNYQAVLDETLADNNIFSIKSNVEIANQICSPELNATRKE